MRDHKSYLENAEEKALKENILSSDLINLYQAIYCYQVEYYNIYKDISPVASFSKTEGIPLLEIENIHFSGELESSLYKGLSAIGSIIMNYNCRVNIDYLMYEMKININLLKDYIRYILNGDIEKLRKVSKEYKIDIDEFIFIIINWLKPLFIYLMEENNENIDYDDWYLNICPFCGYYPDIAKVIDSMGGKKILHCGICESEWPFERISCTICNNRDVEKLGYFALNEDSPYRIDYCEICRGYIKTIRISKFMDHLKFGLYVENLLTLYLDTLALEKGYSRP